MTEIEYSKQLGIKDMEIKGKEVRIAELEAQIEKMKCCAKCSHCNTYVTSCIPQKRFVRLEDVCEDFEIRR